LSKKKKKKKKKKKNKNKNKKKNKNKRERERTTAEGGLRSCGKLAALPTGTHSDEGFL
jgi:hypothetical protein